MSVRYFLFLGNFLFWGYLTAQSNTVSTGGNASGSGGFVSYTIGQIDYISASGTTENINQGVQQPYEIYATSGLQEFMDLIDLTMGPNPTTDALFITVKGELSEELTYHLIDDQGRIIVSPTKLEMNNELNMMTLSSARYQLVISSETNELKIFTVIKH